MYEVSTVERGISGNEFDNQTTPTSLVDKHGEIGQLVLDDYVAYSPSLEMLMVTSQFDLDEDMNERQTGMFRLKPIDLVSGKGFGLVADDVENMSLGLPEYVSDFLYDSLPLNDYSPIIFDTFSGDGDKFSDELTGFMQLFRTAGDYCVTRAPDYKQALVECACEHIIKRSVDYEKVFATKPSYEYIRPASGALATELYDTLSAEPPAKVDSLAIHEISHWYADLAEWLLSYGFDVTQAATELYQQFLSGYCVDIANSVVSKIIDKRDIDFDSVLAECDYDLNSGWTCTLNNIACELIYKDKAVIKPAPRDLAALASKAARKSSGSPDEDSGAIKH